MADFKVGDKVCTRTGKQVEMTIINIFSGHRFYDVCCCEYINDEDSLAAEYFAPSDLELYEGSAGGSLPGGLLNGLFHIGDKVVYEGRVATVVVVPKASIWGEPGNYDIQFADESRLNVNEKSLKFFVGSSQCECGSKYTTFAEGHMQYCAMFKPGGK